MKQQQAPAAAAAAAAWHIHMLFLPKLEVSMATPCSGRALAEPDRHMHLGNQQHHQLLCSFLSWPSGTI